MGKFPNFSDVYLHLQQCQGFMFPAAVLTTPPFKLAAERRGFIHGHSAEHLLAVFIGHLCTFEEVSIQFSPQLCFSIQQGTPTPIASL